MIRTIRLLLAVFTTACLVRPATVQASSAPPLPLYGSGVTVLSAVDSSTNGWVSDGGQQYWYENGVRQGVKGDPKNITDNVYGEERGREIYDPGTNAWYWLDANNGGAKAVNKDVWLPYLFQSDLKTGQNPEGKWVRYDAKGSMAKGIQYFDGSWYAFDEKTGAMIKGWKKTASGNYAFYGLSTGKLKEADFTYQNIMYKIDAVTAHVYYTMPLNVPYYNQRDSRWAWSYIGGYPICQSGCVCCTAASLINFYTGLSLTPVDTGKMFNAWGYYNTGGCHGTNAMVWRQVAKKYGLTYENFMTLTDVKAALRKGNMVAAAVGPGRFVYAGTHSLLLFGLDANNRTYVYDPYEKSLSGWYSVDYIWGQRSSDPGDLLDGGPFFALGLFEYDK